VFVIRHPGFPAGSNHDPSRHPRISALLEDESSLDNSLRPRRLDGFIGQEAVKENLRIALLAAKGRGEALDHLLLYGPPGLGKTTLAQIVARELDVPIVFTSGPTWRPGDLAGLLTNVGERGASSSSTRSTGCGDRGIPLPGRQDFNLDIMIDRGAQRDQCGCLFLPSLSSVPPPAPVSSPRLRSRFGLMHRLDYYSPGIGRDRAAHRDPPGVEIDDAGRMEVAKLSGNARIANRLLRIRDFAQVRARVVTEVAAGPESARGGRGQSRPMDRRYLEALVLKYRGGPVGLNTLAMSVGEEPDTLEDVYEPFLVQQGFLERTPRGRVAAPRTYEHLGLVRTAGAAPQDELFGAG
jgi:Holliday junction DNA helicase RuvB